MTKFILHGGYTKVENESNRKFFDEVKRDAKQILCIYFAKEKERWEEVFENDKMKFNFDNIILADEENVENQIKEADTIYLSGGDTEILKEKLIKINFEDLIKGKTIAGSSAGALVLAKRLYNNDNDKFFDGLNILNIKVFCHYSEEKKDRLEILKQHGEDLKVYVLKDYEFVIVNEEGEVIEE